MTARWGDLTPRSSRSHNRAMTTQRAARAALVQTPARFAVVSSSAFVSGCAHFALGYTDSIEVAHAAAEGIRKDATLGEKISPVEVAKYPHALASMPAARLAALGLI